jgi:hypothetical protein
MRTGTVRVAEFGADEGLGPFGVTQLPPELS